MLTELRIRNFAIIDQLDLTFGPGLNILTGETGAGKSIIIDAVSLLLGDRAAAEWVRSGAEIAEIEAAFVLPTDPELADEIRRMVEEQGVDDPDNPGWVVLAREVRLNGRNICRVNGRSVSLQVMSDIAAALIDVHGQGEHLNLLKPRTHYHLLDRYAGLTPLRSRLGTQAGALRQVRSELQRLRQDARTIAQRLDLLSFQADEITSALLRTGEDEELESERRRLANAEALMSLAQTAQGILSEGEGELPSAVDMVGEAVGKLERLARIDPDMEQIATDAQGLLEQLADLARTLEDYAEGLEFNPERLAEVEERLELIANLKRKYGDTIPQINAYGAKVQVELQELANWEIKTADLEQQEEALLRTIGALAADLSAQRRAAGERLARQVETELADLKMTRARFGVAVEQTERGDGAFLPDGRRVAFDSTGGDQVEFLLSANPGEPLKPMAKVASGGETARLMLALKSTLAHADATPTLIFDEIDQGIGGRVGAVVGKKLWELTGEKNGQWSMVNGQWSMGETETGREDANNQYSIVNDQLLSGDAAPDALQDTKYEIRDTQYESRNTSHESRLTHQILCITHLPQLAAYGDQHYTVNKHVVSVDGQERTTTVVQRLEGEARLDELTQMLGAAGAAGRQSIEEMMQEVRLVKQGARILQ